MKPGFASWSRFALRWILGGVFIYAGAVKIRDPQAFADSIATFQLAPAATIPILALSLPPFEVAAGLALAIGWRTRAMSLAVAMMLAIFLVAIGSALARGLAVDCGCFGSGAPSVWKAGLAVVRDLVLLAAAAWLCRHEWRMALSRPAEPR